MLLTQKMKFLFTSFFSIQYKLETKGQLFLKGPSINLKMTQKLSLIYLGYAAALTCFRWRAQMSFILGKCRDLEAHVTLSQVKCKGMNEMNRYWERFSYTLNGKER